MRKSAPLPVNNLFEVSSLALIQARSAKLSALNSLVYKFLPTTLKMHCRIANYRQGVLIIEVGSASWLTRLRYEQQNLISALRQNGHIELASIQYKINPDLNLGKYILQCGSDKPPKREISLNSALCLRQLAENASPALKSSLIRLANYATKTSNR